MLSDWPNEVPSPAFGNLPEKYRSASFAVKCQYSLTYLEFGSVSYAIIYSKCLDVEKEEKVLEKEVPSVTGKFSVTTSKVSLSQLSEDWHEEVV